MPGCGENVPLLISSCLPRNSFKKALGDRSPRTSCVLREETSGAQAAVTTPCSRSAAHGKLSHWYLHCLHGGETRGAFA